MAKEERLSNKEHFEKLRSEPDLEGGTEQAVEAVKVLYPDGCVLEAEKDGDNTEVTIGFTAVDGRVRILELTVGPNGSVIQTDERPNEDPDAELDEDVQEPPPNESKLAKEQREHNRRAEHPETAQQDPSVVKKHSSKSRATQAREKKGRGKKKAE